MSFRELKSYRETREKLEKAIERVNDILEDWEDNDEKKYWLFFNLLLDARQDDEDGEKAKLTMKEMGISFEEWLKYEEDYEALIFHDF